MDPNSNQISGVGLSQHLGGAGGVQQSYGQIQAAPQPQPVAPIQIADETTSDDQLDQEWVSKAKDIVERTKADPFTQSNELNKIKADYLRARFNKELNVGDKPSQ